MKLTRTVNGKEVDLTPAEIEKFEADKAALAADYKMQRYSAYSKLEISGQLPKGEAANFDEIWAALAALSSQGFVFPDRTVNILALRKKVKEDFPKK